MTLHDADMRDLPAEDPADVLQAKPSPQEVLLGVLDCLWESNLIGPAEVAR